MNRFEAFAPTNIALIKYMGKTDAGLNLPTNTSLSMTLTKLGSRASFEKQRDSGSFVLEGPDSSPRMQKHLERISGRLAEFFSSKPSGVWRWSCENNFPHSAGIASSASSFAASTLGLAAVISALSPKEFEERFRRDERWRSQLASFSREGSGSSIRSFFGPFCEWSGELARKVKSVDTEPGSWVDLICVVDQSPKTVSSGEAHRRVLESPLWSGRPQRAEERTELLRAFFAQARNARKSKMNETCRVIWNEFLDMHSLFHTVPSAFSYWRPRTIEILQWFLGLPEEQRPWVTLDAGPNPHVICETSHAKEWRVKLERQFPDLTILEDHCGEGAALVTGNG